MNWWLIAITSWLLVSAAVSYLDSQNKKAAHADFATLKLAEQSCDILKMHVVPLETRAAHDVASWSELTSKSTPVQVKAHGLLKIRLKADMRELGLAEKALQGKMDQLKRWLRKCQKDQQRQEVYHAISRIFNVAGTVMFALYVFFRLRGLKASLK